MQSKCGGVWTRGMSGRGGCLDEGCLDEGCPDEGDAWILGAQKLPSTCATKLVGISGHPHTYSMQAYKLQPQKLKC